MLRVALTGGIASGKSTVAASLLRVLPPSGETVSGQILFEGADLATLDAAALRAAAGLKWFASC
mgnify:CR=1 FL=1